MDFRTAGAIATLLIGLGGSGGPALAQYQPAPQAYPPPPAYPPPQGPVLVSPPDANDDAPRYDAQGRPLPPAAVGPQANEPPPVRWGRRAPVYAEEADRRRPAPSIAMRPSRATTAMRRPRLRKAIRSKASPVAGLPPTGLPATGL